MKNLVVLFIAAWVVSPLYSQVSETKTFRFDPHDVQITATVDWNFVRKSDDEFELLFGCSVLQNCANIQVGFEPKGFRSTSAMADFVAKELRQTYETTNFSKTQLKTENHDFVVLDFYFNMEDAFVGQTAAICTIGQELVAIVYSSQPMSDDDEAPRQYAVERSRFFEILNSLETSGDVAAVSSIGPFELISCSDSSKILLTREGNSKFFVELHGDHIIHDGMRIVLDDMKLTSFAVDASLYKETDGVELVNDVDILRKYTYLTSAGLFSQLYYQTGLKSASDFLHYSIPLEIKDKPSAMIWYFADVSKKQLRQFKNGASPGPGWTPEMLDSNVGLAVLVEDHIYNLHLFLAEDQTLGQATATFSRMLSSLTYTTDSIDEASPCLAILPDWN